MIAATVVLAALSGVLGALSVFWWLKARDALLAEMAARRDVDRLEAVVFTLTDKKGRK